LRRKGGWKWASTEDRAQAVFDVLNAAADMGVECPSNLEIAETTGMGESSISVNFTRLIDARKISVQRAGVFRIVTITETGRKTKRPAKMRDDAVASE
jgi:hypothetical protein